MLYFLILMLEKYSINRKGMNSDFIVGNYCILESIMGGQISHLLSQMKKVRPPLKIHSELSSHDFEFLEILILIDN